MSFARTDSRSEVLTEVYLRDLYDGNRFIRDADSIITDKQTGLQWLEAPKEVRTWKKGQKWIKSLADGWRTPSLTELRTLFVLDGGGSGSGNMDPVFQGEFTGLWADSGVAPDSMFWPQRCAFYYNYKVRPEGCNQHSNFHKGDAGAPWVNVIAVRTK